ncbi:AbiU2 domain-containing protein [Acuticoccus sediminis]|uniref:AbiU2 domain-containing protein n=1 Tax=Acuticoccus sediminis TaxID=2184697 RepID=UPI001CFD2BB7|nr:hypothetical protein [Acuticoccus sediminis]
MREVIDLNEQTARVCVDDTLRNSLPTGSPAVPAFDQLRFALYWFKVIRLVSLWDPVEENSYSIPTVLRLVDDDDVIAALERETHDHFAALTPRQWNQSEDPELQAEIDRILRRDIADLARTEAVKQRHLIRQVIEKAKQRDDEATTTSIRNSRNYIGHHIQHTRKEADRQRQNKPPLESPTYRDVEILISTTIEIAQSLYLAVNGCNYDLNDMRRISTEMAAELWGNCRFDIEKS